MKANGAPEKIYCDIDCHGCIVEAHHTEWPMDIEYTRTDAFIEKACEFIELNVCNYIDVTHKGGIEHLELQERFIRKFKEAMKI